MVKFLFFLFIKLKFFNYNNYFLQEIIFKNNISEIQIKFIFTKNNKKPAENAFSAGMRSRDYHLDKPLIFLKKEDASVI